MTLQLRRMVWGAAAAALLVTTMASESFAIEGSDFTNYLRGATQGLPLGALPPPGPPCRNTTGAPRGLPDSSQYMVCNESSLSRPVRFGDKDG